MFSIFFKQRFCYLVCVSAKSCSLTLYEFFNRQDLSAIETERNAVFYSKHTAGSPISRFSVRGGVFCKSLRNSHKRHKKTACNRQHFCRQRICFGGGGATCQRTFLLEIFYAQMIKKFAEAICHFIESYRTAKKVS